MSGNKEIPFGKNLTALMKQRRMRLEEVTDMCGVSKSVVHSWMNGSSPRDLLAVKKLADTLGVQFSELLLGEQEQQTSLHADLHQNSSSVFFDGLCRLRIERVTIPQESRVGDTRGVRLKEPSKK
jgi:transcriptional regulator with XRE-family HTH domain